jgi:hypothetical protein
MLSFDDDRWESLTAGYRVPIDLRPILHQLEFSDDPESNWGAIWQELYHQGDVGEGSFAAVPHLVRIHRKRGVVDWNTYSIAAIVELARGVGRNPDVPEWMRESYDAALTDLRRLGLEQLPITREREAIRSILALLAIVHGARTYGRILAEFTEDEVLELEKAAFGDQGR